MKKKCLECNIEFVPIRKNARFCSKKCADKYYIKTHRDEIRKWFREHCLGTRDITGKNKKLTLFIKKREYLGICELCNRKVGEDIKYLDWHHWDDEYPEIGLWLCKRCHHAIEWLDEQNNIEVPKYRDLKGVVVGGKKS
jgi:hypothetical protein